MISDDRHNESRGNSYYADLLTAFALFLSTSILSGRISRLPFDDELYTLNFTPLSKSVLEVFLQFSTGLDIHPPLSYALFSALQHLGFDVTAMHLVSFLLTAAALAILHVVALTLIARRTGEGVSVITRMAAIFLFGLNALAVSQGDALRWYPLFTLLISVFLACQILWEHPFIRLLGAIPLGLAASTNFMASLVILPFAVHRYLLVRRFRASFDIPFWSLVALFGGAGITTALAILPRLSSEYHGQLGADMAQGILGSISLNFLGFFGGNALGISQIWAVIPLAGMTFFAVFAEFDRRTLRNPINLLLLLAYAIVIMVAFGFSKSRSYLYVVPIISAILVLFLDRLRQHRQNAGLVILASLAVGSCIAGLMNIKTSAHPFKRSTAIPFEEIIDFIDTNKEGPTLVLTTDPTLAWAMEAAPLEAGDCISYLVDERCVSPASSYASVYVVSGHFVDTDGSAIAFAEKVKAMTSGRRKIATLHAGLDKDSELKSRLSHMTLDRHLVTVEEFR